jgi:Flp pilus assembly protein TadD
MRAALLILIAAGLAVGCATVGSPPRAELPATAVASAAEDVRVGDAGLSAYIVRVRELSRRFRPRAAAAGELAEHWSQDLADAIARFEAEPTVRHEVGLAQAYVRAGILDHAYEHFAHAARADPREAAAWDGLARVWRDWGFPHLGLGDAYRAASAAPESPIVRNTLGTILQFLGNGSAARVQFNLAVTLDGQAAYAQNNLCYSWVMEANVEAAAAACGLALAIEPGLVPARNNLALARAIQGDVSGAAELFAQSGDEASAEYNLGIVYLSQRRYPSAAAAFDRAALLRPSLVAAGARARQARQHAMTAPADERGSYERR